MSSQIRSTENGSIEDGNRILSSADEIELLQCSYGGGTFNMTQETGNDSEPATGPAVTASMSSQAGGTGDSSSQERNYIHLPGNETNPLESRDAEAVKLPAENGNKGAAQPASTGKEWKSWKLRWFSMAILLFFEAGIIATIVYLERRSANNNGIASVPQVSTSSVSSHFAISSVWKYGLLWTTLPSLVMTLYRIMWDMLVSASADRQPFIELLPKLGKGPSNANVTIMLDYRSYPSFFNWWFAFCNRHIILGFSMILSLFLSIGVVPLTAHLFVTALSQSNSTIALSFPTAFNESLPGTASLQPSIDLATACRAYGGIPPAWMTVEYAFQDFELYMATKSGNITANTYAYSAYLDCQSFSASESSPEYSGDAGDAIINFRLNDRGCAVTTQVGVTNITPTYASTWHVTCSGSEYGRLGIFGGIYDDASPFKIANLSLISCIPTYWIKYGVVSVSYQQDSAPQFISFTPMNSTSFRPELYQTFEDTIENYKFLDPSNSIQADAFGFSVLTYAGTQNRTSPITPDLMQSSMEDVFTTLYAGLVTNLLLQPVNPPSTRNGEFSTPVTRLYVVTPVAYTIVAILFLLFVCNVLLFIYAERHHSILYEQPTGLLGNAPIIQQSDLPQFVSKFRETHRDQYQIRKFVNDNYNTKEATCYIDESTGEIRTEGLKKRERRRK